MVKALVYAYVDCPICGGILPLRFWVVESGFDEDGHADELEVETIECSQCGVLEYGEGDKQLEEKLERLVDDVLEFIYSGQAIATGEIFSYFPKQGVRTE